MTIEFSLFVISILGLALTAVILKNLTPERKKVIVRRKDNKMGR